MDHHTKPRRFSYGGVISEFGDAAVWKFDVQIRGGNLHEGQITAYVGCSHRGDAFQAIFARYPGAKIFGTGFPLTGDAAQIELGRVIDAGEVTLVDDDKRPIGPSSKAPSDLDVSLESRTTDDEQAGPPESSLSPSTTHGGDRRF